ncbi:MAG TPA: ACP phosphodiesterase [Verrucomicrobiae bacterium]|nr:ACP phosphodiesterase [Verrucomicrobiae bacterium]
MNWLAHLHLSEPSPEFRLGNVLPDLLGVRELASLPAEFQRGVTCHRRIDAFTDAHPCFRQSVARLAPPFCRFGGIIMDVFYDHLLAVNWPGFSPHPLRRCLDEFYASFAPQRSRLPAAVWPVLERMREQDWLGSYGDLAGVRLALNRIGCRLSQPRELGACGPELERNYAVLADDFARFYPELRAHVALSGG